MPRYGITLKKLSLACGRAGTITKIFKPQRHKAHKKNLRGAANQPLCPLCLCGYVWLRPTPRYGLMELFGLSFSTLCEYPAKPTAVGFASNPTGVADKQKFRSLKWNSHRKDFSRFNSVRVLIL
jgi:hypothetical protein